VIAKWIRKAVQITEPVKVYRGTTYVGAAETLAIVFCEVCTKCNTGWMERLESAARPVLEPVLLGAAPGTSRVLNPDQQAILATWAVKTSLLLTLSEQIAPSISPIRWPPRAVFGVEDLESLAGRLRLGLSPQNLTN
jgi:hypothetical protein